MSVKIGRYTLGNELGRGGMGVVFAARGDDGRKLALKLLLKADPRRLALFEREKRLLSGFTQAEGYVPLLDSGATEDGPYFVMPHLGGGTLRGRFEDGPLPI